MHPEKKNEKKDIPVFDDDGGSPDGRSRNVRTVHISIF